MNYLKQWYGYVLGPNPNYSIYDRILARHGLLKQNRMVELRLLTSEGFPAVLYLSATDVRDLKGGEALCQSVREFDSVTPILFYSGAAYESDKGRALAAGAQGYVTKPADSDVLVSEILRLLPPQE
jgi:DNA-binding response OmpR family regulator